MRQTHRNTSTTVRLVGSSVNLARRQGRRPHRTIYGTRTILKITQNVYGGGTALPIQYRRVQFVVGLRGPVRACVNF